ncbi:MAG: hypothetical protein ACNA8H_13895, partial [Anaerolineales bacterium]
MEGDDPLKAVYDFAERVHARMQAGEVLNHCLEQNHSAPVQSWVERLVIAGPQNFRILQEILVEVSHRKVQVNQDILQVIDHYVNSLSTKGVRFADYETNLLKNKLAPEVFMTILKEQRISDRENRLECFQLLYDANEVLKNLYDHLKLLDEIETYLQDWMWGMAYQFARQKESKRLDNT